MTLSVITGNPCLGHSEQGPRQFVEGEPTLWRMVPSFSERGSAVEEVQSGTHRSLRLTQKWPLSYVLLTMGRGCPLSVDALAHTWPSVLLSAFHPLCLITPTLVKVKEQSLTLTLIAPDGPNPHG